MKRWSPSSNVLSASAVLISASALLTAGGRPASVGRRRSLLPRESARSAPATGARSDRVARARTSLSAPWSLPPNGRMSVALPNVTRQSDRRMPTRTVSVSRTASTTPRSANQLGASRTMSSTSLIPSSLPRGRASVGVSSARLRPPGLRCGPRPTRSTCCPLSGSSGRREEGNTGLHRRGVFGAHDAARHEIVDRGAPLCRIRVLRRIQTMDDFGCERP